jgi:hypothetical protein
MLTTDISTSFEMKKQTVAAFSWCEARKKAASGNSSIYVEPVVLGVLNV